MRGRWGAGEGWTFGLGVWGAGGATPPIAETISSTLRRHLSVEPECSRDESRPAGLNARPDPITPQVSLAKCVPLAAPGFLATHDEEFLRHMRCREFCETFFRVGRDDRQFSVITRESITRVLRGRESRGEGGISRWVVCFVFW